MKRLVIIAIAVLLTSLCALRDIWAQSIRFEIETNVGVMRGYLYDDVPRHAEAFARHAEKGGFDGTLFARVIPEFMIQGGSSDSRGAKPGARIGSGDRSKEIAHEESGIHFYKKGALAAPKQEPKFNPSRKSDMSQFFIVQGIPYTSGRLDTLEMVKNNPIRAKAMEKYYNPVKAKMDSLRKANPRAFNEKAMAINAVVDSVLQASPDKRIFTPEQREAYTQHGGLPTYDGIYTIYGEVTEGLEVIDKIARQPRDKYDRPTRDMKIIKVRIFRK